MSALPAVAVDLRALVPEPTGIGVYTRSLLLALAARPSARYLGLAHRPPRGREELAAAGIEVEARSAPLGVIWQQLALPRRLARGDVDLLWSPLATLPLASPVPGVVTVHDLTAILYPETHTWKVRWSLVPFLERSLDRARRVVAVSHATARDLAFHFPATAAKTEVVHHGVDPGLTPATREEVAAIRRELDLPEGYVLYVGTIEPRKNLGLLLDAWERLREDRPEMVPPLVVAGSYGWHSRPLLRRLEELAHRLGLRHLGHVPRPQLLQLFRGASVFVYPSLYEGFGLPVAEAMAAGVPVVVSDASSLPEVAGEAGLLVDPRDAGALAAALERVLRDPALAAELAARGLERAQSFRWDRAAARMEELFRRALL